MSLKFRNEKEEKFWSDVFLIRNRFNMDMCVKVTCSPDFAKIYIDPSDSADAAVLAYRERCGEEVVPPDEITTGPVASAIIDAGCPDEIMFSTFVTKLAKEHKAFNDGLEKIADALGQYQDWGGPYGTREDILVDRIHRLGRKCGPPKGAAT